jgi:hypothetical protein
LSSPELPIGTRVEGAILTIRGYRILLDADLAPLYGVSVKALNQAVRRNKLRFPDDFMFQLTADEANNLRSQIVTSSSWGGRRYLPFAFTEQGVAMLSSVLRTEQAALVNVEIMRAFVRLRRLLQQNAELVAKLNALERKYDAQFRVVFDAIRLGSKVEGGKSGIHRRASACRLETCFDLATGLLGALATWGFRSVRRGASPGPA